MHRKESELSKFIWKVKEKGMGDFQVKWQVLAKESGFNKNTKRCQLCTREKLEILRTVNEKGPKVLNKRGELTRRCLHRFKHMLGNISSSSIVQANGANHEISSQNDGNAEGVSGGNENAAVGSILNEQGAVSSMSNERGDDQRNNCLSQNCPNFEVSTHRNEQTSSNLRNEQSVGSSLSNEHGDGHWNDCWGVTRSGRSWRNPKEGIT